MLADEHEAYRDAPTQVNEQVGPASRAKETIGNFACYFAAGLLLSSRILPALALASAASVLTASNYGRAALPWFGIALFLAGLTRYLGMWPA